MINTLFKFADPLYQLERKRQKLLQSGSAPDCLLPLLSQPLPQGNAPLFSQPILAIDIETSGLDAEQDTILSIGMVVIDTAKILLKSACHHYIAQPDAVKAQTAVINHITPELLKNGITQADALALFVQQAQGKWLLAHGCSIEQTFLAKAFGLKELPLLWLDTLNIEKSLLLHARKNSTNYGLSQLRRHYELPDYTAHNALADALACAELFVAQLRVLFAKEPATIQPLYQRSVKAAP